MEGMEAVFSDVSFGDAKVAFGEAMKGNPAQDAGKAGTPAPAATPQGQPGGTPTATANQDPGKSPVPQGDKSDTGADKGNEKPAPYDKDPKWLKAREAERRLTEILEKHSLLDVEELVDRLSKGSELQKLIGERDAKKLIEDAEYANRVRQNWEKQRKEEQFKDEPPDTRLQRLEAENAKLKQEYDDYKSGVADKEHAQKVLDNFNGEVSRVLDVLETPLGETERELVTLMLGVNNPANEIDIEDQTAVRKMAREGITKFQAAVQKIRQAAIDEYVAGKKGMAVDTTTGAPASVPQGVTPKPIPKDATVDQVFGNAKTEFLEVLLKGSQAAMNG